jgi:hypothetical protein
MIFNGVCAQGEFQKMKGWRATLKKFALEKRNLETHAGASRILADGDTN